MSIASTGEYETPNSINGFDEASGEIINLNSATHSSNGLSTTTRLALQLLHRKFDIRYEGQCNFVRLCNSFKQYAWPCNYFK